MKIRVNGTSIQRPSFPFLLEISPRFISRRSYALLTQLLYFYLYTNIDHLSFLITRCNNFYRFTGKLSDIDRYKEFKGKKKGKIKLRKGIKRKIYLRRNEDFIFIFIFNCNIYAK